MDKLNENGMRLYSRRNGKDMVSGIIHLTNIKQVSSLTMLPHHTAVFHLPLSTTFRMNQPARKCPLGRIQN